MASHPVAVVEAHRVISAVRRVRARSSCDRTAPFVERAATPVPATYAGFMPTLAVEPTRFNRSCETSRDSTYGTSSRSESRRVRPRLTPSGATLCRTSPVASSAPSESAKLD
jgi:hypothetical protein